MSTKTITTATELKPAFANPSNPTLAEVAARERAHLQTAADAKAGHKGAHLSILNAALR